MLSISNSLSNKVIILKNLAKQEKTHSNSFVSCLPFFTNLTKTALQRVYMRASGIGRQIELLCYYICAYTVLLHLRIVYSSSSYQARSSS
jgi:hypothetical protein